jgi:gas vesicle protein
MDRDGLTNFLIGLGVGVGIGILFAPKAGDETRDFIKSKANEGTDYLKRTSSDWKSTADDLIEKGKTVINRQKDNLNEAVEAGKQAYKEKVEPKLADNPV